MRSYPRVKSIGFAAALAIVVFGSGYGIFRDELYYWVCARHLAWGYVDHPPFSMAVLRLFGDHLLMMKVPGAIAFGLSVYLMGRQSVTMGAGRWGSLLAAAATALCPLLAAVAGFFSMNVLEIAFWAVATTVTSRLLVQPTPTRWVILGIVVGLGLLNKYSMLLFAAGFGAGLLCTPARVHLRTPWPWIAAVLAALIVSPHAIWQIRHGNPSLEFIANATELKMAPVAALDLLAEQLLVTNPVIAVLWLAGLGGLLLNPHLRPWRAHGIAFIVAAGVLIGSGTARAAYFAPAYMLLLPAAGVMAERLVSARFVWARYAILAMVGLSSAAMLPLALPILPVERLIAYQRIIGFTPRAEERARIEVLPQFFADRFGWKEMAAAVERAYLALPDDERARTFVFTRNYGEGAAIEYFSPALRDKVLSGHNNYHLWFPNGWDGSELLVIGEKESDIREAFAEVRQVGTTDHPHAMPYERNLAIYLARQPLMRVEELREAIKHYE